MYCGRVEMTLIKTSADTLLRPSRVRETNIIGVLCLESASDAQHRESKRKTGKKRAANVLF